MYEGRYRIIVNPNTANEKIYENKNMILRRAKTYAFGGPLRSGETIGFYVFRYYLDDNTLRDMYYNASYAYYSSYSGWNPPRNITLDYYVGEFSKTVDATNGELTVASTTSIQSGPIDIYGVYIEWHYRNNYYPIAVSRVDPYLSLTDTDTYVIQYVLKLRW